MTSMSVEDLESRRGWVVFAAIVMLSVGFYRLISGISYLANSHKINDFTAGLFGDNMWAWGLWDLGIAILALWAGYSLLGNGGFGRVVAYLWAVLVIVNSFLVIGYAPWFAFAMIALAIFVIYGLTSSPKELTEQYAERTASREPRGDPPGCTMSLPGVEPHEAVSTPECIRRAGHGLDRKPRPTDRRDVPGEHHHVRITPVDP